MPVSPRASGKRAFYLGRFSDSAAIAVDPKRNRRHEAPAGRSGATLRVPDRKGAEIRFQNLGGARKRVQDVFGFDFADGLPLEDWATACRVFQKRHLLAHKTGVIDEDYLEKAHDPGAICGRKVRVTADEVASAIAIIETLGKALYAGVLKTAAWKTQGFRLQNDYAYGRTHSEHAENFE